MTRDRFDDSTPTPRRRGLPIALLGAAAILAAGCGEPGPTPTAAESAPAFAKGGNGNGNGGGGGNGDVTVRDTDPDSASRGDSLTVLVKGKGFEPGDSAAFLLDEEDTEFVTAHATRFVSSRELEVDVSVTEDAALDFYDVAVYRGGNRRGIGIELFEVVVHGNQDFSATLTLRDDPGDGIRSDGGGGYDDGVRIANGQNHGVLFLGIADPRTLTVAFGDPIDGTAGCATDGDCRKDFDTIAVGVSGALQVLRSEDPADTLPGHLLGMSVGQELPAMLRFGFSYPPDDKQAPRYQTRFQFPTVDPDAPINAEIAAQSSFLTITRTSTTAWTVAASAPADSALLFSKKNKGPKSEREPRDEGSFHLPFVMTVSCGDCVAADG